eukprot:Awhi_evm1s4048
MGKVDHKFEVEEISLSSFDPDNPQWSQSELEEIENGLNWRLGVSLRSIVLGIVVGTLCTFMLLKIILWNGASTPGWSLPAVLLSYVLIKMFMFVTKNCVEFLPLSKYELVCIQTIVVAITSVTSGLGYGTYLAAMQPNPVASYQGLTYEQLQANPSLWSTLDTYTEDLGYAQILALAVSLAFTSVNLVTILRKTMIVEYKLPFPSPTATAMLITSFTDAKSKENDKKISIFSKVGGAFFVWACVSWLFAGTVYYSGVGSACSSFAIPILGLGALRYSWYVNANAENLLYSGIACLTPRNVNFSSVFGSIFFFGILFPIIWSKGYEVADVNDPIPAGYWFAYGGGTNFYSGMGGYEVFLMICCVLGNGLYVVCDMAKEAVKSFYIRYQNDKNEDKVDDGDIAEIREEALRIKIMEESTLNKWILLAMFVTSAVAGAVIICFVFPIEWYYVVIGYIIFPIIAVINVYLTGLTDQGITFLIAKGLIFAFGSWVNDTVGEYYGLPQIMLILGIIAFGSQNSSDIMGDYKTAFVLKASSTSMYICEMIGLMVGCFLSPAVYIIFKTSSPDIGFADSAYPIAYAPAYIGVGHIALSGFGALPKYATTMGAVFFIVAFLASPFKDYVIFYFVKSKNARKYIDDFWPNWMVMGLYAYLGPGDYMVPLAIGWISCEIWKQVSKHSASKYQYIVGAAVIVGVTIWGIPQCVLGLANVESPMCLTAWPTLSSDLQANSNSIFDLTNY